MTQQFRCELWENECKKAEEKGMTFPNSFKYWLNK